MSTSEEINVSRETLQRLEVYVELLTKWNSKINLVGKSTLPEVWSRHIADSLQLLEVVPATFGTWADLGSGGGLPGLVLAIACKETAPASRFELVESDARKSAFLRTVIRETGVNATVLTGRIEALHSLRADVVSARALAELRTLLHYADLHMAADGTAVFPKGANWEKEVEDARKDWRFEVEPVKSNTDNRAAILLVKGIQRV